MWKKGKKRGVDSGGGDSGPLAKFAKNDADDRSGDILVCELSKSRRVTVRSWQGKTVVDIREFYVKDGKELPGKKGICLPLDQLTFSLLESSGRYCGAILPKSARP